MLLRLRFSMLLQAANRKGSWNKARIRYQCCACRWAGLSGFNPHRQANSLPWHNNHDKQW